MEDRVTLFVPVLAEHKEDRCAEMLFECHKCGNAADICDHGEIVCCDRECGKCVQPLVDAVMDVLRTPKALPTTYAKVCKRGDAAVGKSTATVKEVAPVDPNTVWIRQVIAKNKSVICRACSKQKNVKFEDGNLVQVFCEGCRRRIAKVSSNLCTGGSSHCMQTRWVSPLGELPELCVKCDHVRLGA